MKNVVVISYLIVVYIFSASSGFLFFIDSKTYLSGGQYAPILSELLAIYPVGTAALAIVNTTIVYKMTKKYGINLFTIFLLSPYNMLLLTNATKESIIFFGLFISIVAFNNTKNGVLTASLRLAGVATLVIRPVYALLYVSRLSPYLMTAMVLLFLISVAFSSVPMEIYEPLGRMEDKEYIGHVGRDFFSYLCVKEKADLISFTQCWVPVFLGVPLHKDTLSVNYLSFILFQIPFLYLVYLSVISKSYRLQVLAIIAIVSHYLLFIISPTFGAFIRYAHPVVWMLGFSILTYKSGMLRRFKFRLSQSGR